MKPKAVSRHGVRQTIPGKLMLAPENNAGFTCTEHIHLR